MGKETKTKSKIAVALLAIQSIGVNAGDIITGQESVIAELVASGKADANESAVAYAKENGAQTVEV